MVASDNPIEALETLEAALKALKTLETLGTSLKPTPNVAPALLGSLLRTPLDTTTTRFRVPPLPRFPVNSAELSLRSLNSGGNQGG